MKDPQHDHGALCGAAPPLVLATSLCWGALGIGCGAPERAPLPLSQPKVTAARTQPLLGADLAGVVTAKNTVINTYAKLVADAKAGDSTVTVGDAAALDLKAGDLILVTQLQGAVIESSDTAGGSGYGLVKASGGAGSYEIASVKAVDTRTNVITLNYCAGLKNSYAVAGHSQVVRVPQYTSLEIKDGGAITALPWDGDKGGVIAAYVQGKTLVAGSIDASAAGFRGGAVTSAAQDGSKIVTTYRSTTAADGAEHGEGIAGYQKEYDALGGRYGRGAPANGGGGGNSNGGGGGGGANGNSGKDWTGQGVMPEGAALLTGWMLDPGYKSNGNKLTTSSGGGRGGYTYSANFQLTALVGPGNTGWGGNNRQEAGGLGGRPLASGAKSALFFGGGGGAGNGSDGAAGGGGRGGGLIYLVTGALEGSGAILASGSAGERTKPGTAGNDGAGGGGAGGTIVVLAGRQIGATVKLSADGGAGGSQFVTINNEAEGPGGGGGGGYIGTFTPPQLPTTAPRSATGAASGVTDSAAMLLFNINGATAGAEGKTSDTYTYADGPLLPVCVPADVSVRTTFTKGRVSENGTAELTVTITNSGPEPAQAVALTDTISSGTGAVTWSCTASGGATCPSATGTGSIKTITDLPVRAFLTYVVTVPLPAGFTGPLNYSAGASVPPGFNDLKLGNNASAVTLPIGTLPAADLAITLGSVPNPAPRGQAVTYRVGVQNRGPGTATGATFLYTFAPGSTIQDIAAPTGWSCPLPAPQATTVTCTYTPSSAALGVPLGVLPEVVITLLPPELSTSVLSSAVVTGLGITDPSAANNTALNDTLIGDFPAADITIGINSRPNPAPPDTAISYDLRVTNNGPSLATGATIYFAVPIGSAVQSFDNSVSGWVCTSVVSAVSCTYAQSFPQGSLPTATITLLPEPMATSLAITAQASGRGVADPDPANNTASELTPISDTPAEADLVLTVTTTPTEPQQNLALTYNLNITNRGPGAVTGAVLTYDLPAGGTVQHLTAPTGWSCAELTAQNQVSCRCAASSVATCAT